MKTKPRDPKICITYPVFGDQNIKWYSRKGKKKLPYLFTIGNK